MDYLQEGFRPRPAELWRKVGECDAIVGWFASWHTALALRFARMRGKPSLLIFGGFDTAAMPEIGYGSQRGGVRRRLVRSTANLATRLVTNSESSLREIAENDRDRYRARRGRLSRHPRPLRRRRPRRPARAHGADRRRRLRREPAAQGSRPVLRGRAQRARRRVGPGRRVVGRHRQGAPGEGAAEPARHRVPLRRRSGRPLPRAAASTSRPRFTRASACRSPRRCWRAPCRSSPRRALCPRSWATRASCSTEATAESIAAGVAEALALGPEAHVAARERVRTEFPYEKRRDGILRELDHALAGERS